MGKGFYIHAFIFENEQNFKHKHAMRHTHSDGKQCCLQALQVKGQFAIHMKPFKTGGTSTPGRRSSLLEMHTRDGRGPSSLAQHIKAQAALGLGRGGLIIDRNIWWEHRVPKLQLLRIIRKILIYLCQPLGLPLIKEGKRLFPIPPKEDQVSYFNELFDSFGLRRFGRTSLDVQLYFCPVAFVFPPKAEKVFLIRLKGLPQSDGKGVSVVDILDVGLMCTLQHDSKRGF